MKTSWPDLFVVTLWKLKESLWNEPVSKSYPLSLVDQETVSKLRKEADQAFAKTDPREVRHALWQLGHALKSATIESLAERRELVGVFPTFESAERYTTSGANDWDDCGMYNLASIQRIEAGFLYNLARREDFTFYRVDDGGKGYRGHGVDLKGVKTPHPERFSGHLWTK